MFAANGEGAIAWKISDGPWAKPAMVELKAGMQLRRTGGAGSLEWESCGEGSCFRAASLPLRDAKLPGGWYEIHGRLTASEGHALMPCLYLGYAHAVDAVAQIPLPEPAADGRIDVLLLLPYDVASLQFSPSFGPSRFEVEGFVLRRTSRLHALWRMLLPLAMEKHGWWQAWTRVLRFLSAAASTGLSEATSALFSEYKRRANPQPPLGDYENWVRCFDTPNEAGVLELSRRAEQVVENGPMISVLVPAYQTPERWLRRCIDSVLAQVYPKWQLCLADDASPDPGVMRVLREYAARDSRINVMRRERNGHISEASNSALELARGEYVALLDHDDELRPHALLEMAEAIAATSDVGLLYSDEDKIDGDGRRFDPYFKPDWDPDLLRSQNYICHLTVIRTDLVRAVGGFRKGFEGSQDHDLILRCTERLLPSQIVHIPKVLYHWRAIPGSTALSRDAKDYAASAGVRAVAEQLSRCATGALAEELSHGHYRVRWPLPESLPKVSLVIPTRDKANLLRQCIDSILQRSTYNNFEILIVDNGSSEPDAIDYLASLKGERRIRVLRYDKPFNYSAINNWAVSQCDGEVIGLVNNDIEVITPDWLEEMVSHAVRTDVGAVGAMLYYPGDTIQHAGVVLGIHGVAAHVYGGLPRGYPGHGGRARVAQGLSAVTGACLLVLRDRYELVGGLDERLAVAFNDIDFCLRLRQAGFRNVWTPFAELYHHESASRGAEDTEEKRQRFSGEIEFMCRRWGTSLQADPAYNVNLSLDSRNFELSVPPRSVPVTARPGAPAAA